MKMAKFDKALFEKAEEMLRNFVIENKMRMTTERLTVLSYIVSYKKMFTADELVKEVCGPNNISVATIYNNLAIFCDAHIIRMVPSRQKQGAKYELTIGKTNSLVYVCTRCGREVNFKNTAIMNMLQASKFTNFEPDNFSLVLYGHCKSCRSKIK